jgi:two-component system phosphate regulon response regulator PhoB
MSTILVVDSSAVCREPMAAILESHGHRVLRAADAWQAMNVLNDEEPDLILLEVVITGSDGLSLLETLRADPRHRNRPVILVTAMADRACIFKARALGVQGYLLKTSFSVDQMLARVRECLKPKAGEPVGLA